MAHADARGVLAQCSISSSSTSPSTSSSTSTSNSRNRRVCTTHIRVRTRLQSAHTHARHNAPVNCQVETRLARVLTRLCQRERAKINTNFKHEEIYLQPGHTRVGRMLRIKLHTHTHERGAPPQMCLSGDARQRTNNTKKKQSAQ